MKYAQFLASIRAAARGISFSFAHERNFRIELYITIVLFFFLIITHATVLQWFAVIIMIVLVLAAELTNTALERIVDILKPQKHPYARVIKDIAAGMVLVVAIGVSMSGAIVLWPLVVHFVDFFFLSI